MARTIWKHMLDVRDPRTWAVQASPRAAVLAARAMSAQEIEVWVEFDPREEAVSLSLFIVGTGHPIPARACHECTVFAHPFVWHLYQLAPEGNA